MYNHVSAVAAKLAISAARKTSMNMQARVAHPSSTVPPSGRLRGGSSKENWLTVSSLPPGPPLLVRRLPGPVCLRPPALDVEVA